MADTDVDSDRKGRFINSMKRMFIEYVFEYETPKIIAITSFKLGLTYRFIQLVIIAYIVGYVIIYTRGYQDMEVGQSTITTKVKGIASSMNRLDLPAEYSRVWDYADYVIPPMSKDSLFIMTNAVLTSNQTISTCPEDPSVGKHVFCDPLDANITCTPGQMLFNGNGITTGECVKSSINYTCEITGWCPLEDDSIAKKFHLPLLPEFENFTIFLKNVVEFPYFKVKRRNVDNIQDVNYIKKCTYHPEKDPLCPIFKVSDIIHLAKADIKLLPKYGGILNVLVNWDCDLDYRISYCNPTFTFGQMDETGSKFSTGFNFRYANFYKVNGEFTRDLVKAYGILFVFNIDARARKFSIVQLSMNVGAGLALLGLATVLMDMLLTNFSRDRKFYKEQKFITLSSTIIHEQRRISKAGLQNGDRDFKSVESLASAEKTLDAS